MKLIKRQKGFTDRALHEYVTCHVPCTSDQILDSQESQQKKHQLNFTLMYKSSQLCNKVTKCSTQIMKQRSKKLLIRRLVFCVCTLVVYSIIRIRYYAIPKSHYNSFMLSAVIDKRGENNERAACFFMVCEPEVVLCQLYITF